MPINVVLRQIENQARFKDNCRRGKLCFSEEVYSLYGDMVCTSLEHAKTNLLQEQLHFQNHGFSVVFGDVRGNKVSNCGSEYPAGLDRGDGCK
jgi:hypothetical protein